ncbi:MAG: zinc-ribbon domain containing protein [Chloroflexi bacterium]|nr:zinc-ribbon domain containing protein [Chloroflexota bacterium]
MSYQDRNLTCQECGKQFVYSADDQSFHALKGYTNEPKRCPSCRQARREGSGSSSRGSYPRTEQREMFPAVCASCGKETTVPFRPKGDRPVYCSDCFRRQPARSGRY